MRVLGGVLATLTIAVASLVVAGSAAYATTDPSTLVGEGGSFAEPLIVQLINDASPSISPEYAGYSTLDVNSGQAGFANGSEDFAATEYPLTAANQAEAASIGRTYVYVPFAAIPVAIGVDLLVGGDNENTPDQPSSFFQDMQFTQHQLFCVFVPTCGATFFPLGRDWDATPDLADTSVANAAACAATNDPNSETCQQLPVFDTEGGSQPITVDLPEEPDASIGALATLFANDPTSKTQWNTWSTGEPLAPGTASNPEDEIWPAPAGNGDDQNVEVALFPSDPALANGSTGPIDEYATWPFVFGYEQANGSIAPLPNDWVAPYVPTAKIQNSAGDYVAATPASAQAALGDSTVGSNNIVNLPVDDPNPAAYPLTEMSYFVFPTSGLPATKYTAIAQLLQFVLGSSGAADITAAGAAPITQSADPQLYAADEKAVGEMNSLASAANASVATSTSTTTTTTVPPTNGATASTTTTTTTTTIAPSVGTTPSGFVADGEATIGPAGGTISGITGSARITVSVPAGALPTASQVEIATAPASSIHTIGAQPGDKVEMAIALTVSDQGAPVTGELAAPVSVEVESLAIGQHASLFAYDAAKKGYVPATPKLGVTRISTSVGLATFEIISDPEVALVEPPAIPAKTTTLPVKSGSTGVTTTLPAIPTPSTTPPKSPDAGGSTGKGGTLAFTGSSPGPLVAAAMVLLVGGELLRRSRGRTRGTFER